MFIIFTYNLRLTINISFFKKKTCFDPLDKKHVGNSKRKLNQELIYMTDQLFNIKLESFKISLNEEFVYSFNFIKYAIMPY